jgi:hypothetical protein
VKQGFNEFSCILSFSSITSKFPLWERAKFFSSEEDDTAAGMVCKMKLDLKYAKPYGNFTVQK